MIKKSWRWPAKRLQLRQLTELDTDFVIELVNDPMWLNHIGDRNVHTTQQALSFIQQGPLSSYQDNGFGLYVFESLPSFKPMGLCGLLQRDFLAHPDIGYAILPQFRGQGLTFEACQSVLEHDLAQLKFDTLHAMISPENQPSIRLIERLGFHYSKQLNYNEKKTLLYSRHYT